MLWWMVDDPVIMAMDDITSVSNASSYMMEGYQVPRAYFEDHAEGRYDLVLLDTRTTARAPSPQRDAPSPQRRAPSPQQGGRHIRG